MIYFDHEKLIVYKKTVEFIEWATELMATIVKNIAVMSQLDRASTSIALNIAEGNGKYTSADRCNFFDIARGSALECASCLDILLAKKKINESVVIKGKEMLSEIVSMLIGLIRSNSGLRNY